MTTPKVADGPQGWRLVTHGSWEVSVGPDGLLMLPRHLHPDEVDDFVAAVKAAAEVGRKLRAANTERAKADSRSLPARAVIIQEGGVPPGAVRLPLATGSNTPAASSIGRRPNHTPPSARPPQPAGTQGQPRPAMPSLPPSHRP